MHKNTQEEHSQHSGLHLNPQHEYHLVDASPWPVLTSISLFYLTLSGVALFHFFTRGPSMLCLAIAVLVPILACWWRDVVREGTFNLHHTIRVQIGLRYGMILFIISEVLFFFAFFRTFFHSSLAPTHAIGCVWPPAAICVFSPFQVPLLNTCLLLTSGATITLAHYNLLVGNRIWTIEALKSTVSLAVLFTLLQAYEYLEAPFSIADGIYASTFYVATGFHGLHVMIGTLFILIGFERFRANHFTYRNHFGFEAAARHWHFVDVIWLIPYISIYYWGNL